MILSQSRHGGDIFKLPGGERDGFLDFSININPLGLSPKGKEALIRSWEKEVLRYPDMECRELISALANRYGMPDRMITVGNGATEIMYTLLRVLLPGKVYVPAPSFSEYRLSAESVNAKVEEIPLSAKTDFKIPVEFFTKIEPKSVVYLGNPNNPDGQILNEERLKQILPLVEKTQSYLILDESFVDFLGDSFSYRKLCLCHRQVIIVSSLTKFYAVPGLRIGCSFSTEEIAKKCQEQLIPWHVNGLVQTYMKSALADDAYIQRTREYCKTERNRMITDLSAIDSIKVYPGSINFFLCKLTRKFKSAYELQQALWPYKIILRQCGNYAGLDESYFRIAVKIKEENLRLVNALRKVLE